MAIRRSRKPTIIQRTVTPDDFAEIIKLSKKCFPDQEPWKIEMLESQYTIFPEGMQVIEYEGEIVGSATSLIVDMEEYEDNHTWSEISDNGYITNHDPEGDTLYGIEVMVHPEYQGLKIGRRLYEMRRELCEHMNLRQILIGGRLPNYHLHSEDLGVRAYVKRVLDKKIKDPVLTFQVSQNFYIRKIIKDYLPMDKESEGYGVLMEWTNLDYVAETRQRSITTKKVRICCIQYEMRKINGFEDFAQQCEFFTDVASNYKSDFALFPELFTTQLLSFIENKGMSVEDNIRELDNFTDDYINLFSRLSVEYNINIVAGTHLLVEGGNLYNVAFLFKRDGTFDKQYKIHITPNESKWWGVKPGNEIKIFNTDCGKVGINICYDSEFPEMARLQTDKGAHILFVPFCTDERHGYLRVKLCSQARAIENQIYVATAGTIGNIPSVENMDINYAQSGIYTPSDFAFPPEAIAGECSPNLETVVIADLDLAQLERSRKSGTVQNIKDRRSDLYHVVEVD
ncbi:MAG: GNAT family N-acetyltransferase [Bacteroidetes bacterium]|nr:MAG: GNAT family N-acetyltransferase [Bacteroidota bacterium]